MFKVATGDLLGLPTNERHINVKWEGSGNVLFSMTKLGESLSCHFASDKAGLRHIKQAINEFCEWAFNVFKWCKMIIATVKIPSVARVVKKCGFSMFGTAAELDCYMRIR